MLTAPDQRGFVGLLTRLDREVFRTSRSRTRAAVAAAGGPQAAPARRLAGEDQSRAIAALTGVPLRASARSAMLGAAAIAIICRRVIVLPDASFRRIAAIDGDDRGDRRSPSIRPARGSSTCPATYVVPGFIDVHVHGVEGLDTLDGTGVRGRDRRAAAPLRRDRVLPDDGRVRSRALRRVPRGSARVPRSAGRRERPACCRRISRATSSTPSTAARSRSAVSALRAERGPAAPSTIGILRAPTSSSVIAAARAEVGIVTLAPELPGASTSCAPSSRQGTACRSVTRAPTSTRRSRRSRPAPARDAPVQPDDADDASRARPGRRRPRSRGVAAELICDGYHVHPAMCQVALSRQGHAAA